MSIRDNLKGGSKIVPMSVKMGTELQNPSTQTKTGKSYFYYGSFKNMYSKMIIDDGSATIINHDGYTDVTQGNEIELSSANDSSAICTTIIHYINSTATKTLAFHFE